MNKNILDIEKEKKKKNYLLSNQDVLIHLSILAPKYKEVEYKDI